MSIGATSRTALVIAVDGPAASGKSTIARALARRFELAFLDTGLLYRAVGRRVLLAGGEPTDAATALAQAEALTADEIDEAGLKGDEIGVAGSKVAAFPAVRAALLPFQRRFATSGNGAILAGRDVGTVIFPDAQVKLFITASVQTRSKRRFEELRRGGGEPIESQVLEDMIERDRRDTCRVVAPLRVAEDAHLLDTSDLSVDATLQAAVELIERSLAGGGTASAASIDDDRKP